MITITYYVCFLFNVHHFDSLFDTNKCLGVLLLCYIYFTSVHCVM